jgi:hypothetical protein
MGWTARVRFPTGRKDNSLLHSVKTDSGAQHASYPTPTKDYFPWSKAGGREADHSPPSSVYVKNGGPIPLIPLPRLYCVVLN